MFRREVLEAIGGFDPELGPGARFSSCEDPGAAAGEFRRLVGPLYTPQMPLSPTIIAVKRKMPRPSCTSI